MAARTRKVQHDDFTRQKIQTSQLVNRLTDHVFGKIELSSTQVTAALGLLKKALPDLGSMEVKADVTTTDYVVYGVKEAKDADQWVESISHTVQ